MDGWMDGWMDFFHSFIILFNDALDTYLSQEKGRKEMFYLTMHSTHFIYGYMASDIWLRTILIVKKETCCRHIGYSFWLTARVLLYAPSHRQDSTYHSFCYTSCQEKGFSSMLNICSWFCGLSNQSHMVEPIDRQTDRQFIQYFGPCGL